MRRIYRVIYLLPDVLCFQVRRQLLLTYGSAVFLLASIASAEDSTILNQIQPTIAWLKLRTKTLYKCAEYVRSSQ